MLNRRRRLAASFLAIGLLAAMLFAVDSLTLPSPAEARCKGVNNPVTSWFAYERIVRVTDTPVSGTCNGNNVYVGVLKDERADGYCVSVWFKEAGRDWMLPEPAGAGIVCGAGNTSQFEWHDINGNSTVYQQFCIDKASNHQIVACGWGNIIGDYATNWGY